MAVSLAQVQELLDKVREAYSNAAANPGDSHPFPNGFDFALSVGYPEDLLRSLAESAVQRFTGVSNVSVFPEITAGSTILDFDCGSGTDSLIAAAKTGSEGKVHRVDFSPSMLALARASASEAGAANVEFQESEGQYIPFADGTFDVAIVNGIFNLNLDRASLFQELARVIRPGGVLYGAEIVLREPMEEQERASLANWFS